MASRLDEIALQVFNEADIDHSNDLDTDELAHLIIKLWQRIGQPMPLSAPQYANRMRALVEQTMERFDADRSGRHPDYIA